jgi:hypothetical protein
VSLLFDTRALPAATQPTSHWSMSSLLGAFEERAAHSWASLRPLSLGPVRVPVVVAVRVGIPRRVRRAAEEERGARHNDHDDEMPAESPSPTPFG